MMRDQGIRGTKAQDIEDGSLGNAFYDGTNLCLMRPGIRRDGIVVSLEMEYFSFGVEWNR